MIPLLKKNLLFKSLTFSSNYLFARNFKFPLQDKATLPPPEQPNEEEKPSNKKDGKMMKQLPKKLDFLEKDFEKMMQSNPKILDINKAFSDDNDKELEKLIKQKIDEGKNDESILAEILGKSMKKFEVAPKKEKSDKIELPFLDGFDKLIEPERRMKNKTEKDPLKEELYAEISQMKKMKEIFEESDEKPLTELPTALHYSKSRKFTKEEKEDSKLKSALKMSEYQEDLLQKMKSAAGQTSLEEDYKQNVPMRKMEPTDKDIAKMKIQASMPQLNEKILKELSEKDDINAAKAIDVYEPKPKEGDRHLKRIKDKVEETTWDKSLQKIQDMKKNIEILNSDDEDLLKDIVKEEVFAKKKLLEEKAKQKEILNKKERLKKFRNVEEELNKDMRREDTDYKEFSKKKPKEEEKENTPNLDDILEGQFESEKTLLPTDEKLYNIHSIKTTRNVENYIFELFSMKKRSFDFLTENFPIEIVQIIPNNALTVFNIIWEIGMHTDSKEMLDPEERDKIVSLIEPKLKKSRKYIGGLICRDLGFKFAPDIRFYYSKKHQKDDEIDEEIQRILPDVVRSQVRDVFEKHNQKPVIKKKIYTQLIEETYDKLQTVMRSQRNYDQIIGESKSQKQFDADGKRIRNNRTPDGKRKKTVRKDRIKSFWNGDHMK